MRSNLNKIEYENPRLKLIMKVIWIGIQSFYTDTLNFLESNQNVIELYRSNYESS